ncbi:hypothetical protein ACX40Y_01920 [Sphingomonas sp. RS6]
MQEEIEMLFPLILALTATATEPAGQDSQSIVVTAEQRANDQALRAFVHGVSARGPATEPLARFTGTVCVGATGLPAEANRAIVDRVSGTAASLGLRVGEPGCTPNLIVLFVENGSAAVRRLAKGNSNALEGASIPEIRRIRDEPGRARAWISTETLSRDGDRPTRYISDPAFLTVSASTRLSSPVRRDIVRSTVLIDRDAVAGMNLARVADYVAMRGLSGARPQPDLGTASILSLFAPGGDQTAPAAMTEVDRGYLEGLYAGSGDRLPRIQQAAIARHIRDTVAAGTGGGDD